MSFLNPFKSSVGQKKFMRNSFSSPNIPSLILKTKESFKSFKNRYARSISNAVNVYTVDYNGTIKDGISGRIHNDSSSSSYENTFALLTIDLSKTRLETTKPEEITFQISASFTQTYYSYTIYDFDESGEDTRRAQSSISKGILSIHPCRFKAENNILKMMIFHFTSTPDTETIYSSSISYFTNKTKSSVDKKDVSYSNLVEQTFDIHIPGNKSHCHPIMVFIHGGTWDNGDKSYMSIFHNQMNTEDFVSVNLNYRQLHLLKNYSDTLDFDSTPSLTDMLDDINACLKFVCKEYKSDIDVDRITLFGYSAGAHLSMMYANNYYKSHRSFSIKNVISLGGPAKLYADEFPITYSSTADFKRNNITYSELLSITYSYLCKKNLFGESVSCNEIRQISPCETMDSDSQTEFIFYYSEKDETVLYSVQTDAIRKSNLPSNRYHIKSTSLSIGHGDFDILAKDKSTFDSNFGSVLSNYCI